MTDETEVPEEREGAHLSRRGARRRSGARSTPTPKKQRQPSVNPTVRRIVLRNRRAQLITPSVLNDHGAPVTLRIPPYGRVEVFEDRLTEYTRVLVAQEHLSIDPAR